MGVRKGYRSFDQSDHPKEREVHYGSATIHISNNSHPTFSGPHTTSRTDRTAEPDIVLMGDQRRSGQTGTPTQRKSDPVRLGDFQTGTAAGRALTLAEALTAYQETYLAGRNLAPRTRTEYRTDLRQVCEFLSSCGASTAQAVERTHLERFLARLDQLGLGGAIRRRKVASIRSFFLFLENAGHRRGNPASKLVPPERERNQPRFLTEREYKQLLDAVRYDARDAAIIELLLQTGLRLSEIARLRLSDIELPVKVIRPNRQTQEPGSVGSARINGKGRRQRTVTLNWKVCKALKAYLAVRPPDAADDAVFQTKFRRGIGPRSIELLVTKHLSEAGIKDASVHSLRHTFATHSAIKGTSPRVIQETLGHADLKTTTIYVGLAREEMDRQLQENAL